ncbi:hypothetical protein GCM10010912_38330 [Paenibacillus albidus]|uniref:Uncharacterized protein n=1 Tax=Paenibacillus albidus TaxID=2041023 RepID=A0A917CKT5_9BACL|nr:hypothetical protein GCM10010912_38330 [Paenibacillus albidus]
MYFVQHNRSGKAQRSILVYFVHWKSSKHALSAFSDAENAVYSKIGWVSPPSDVLNAG